MSETYTNRQLYELMEGLRQDVKEGFLGVHSRQDQTNGRVRASEKKIWAICGGLVVVASVVVPLFINLVK